MSKWLRVTSVLAVLLATECRFVGDKCQADGRSGVCSLLLECQPLLDEVERAGKPMPGYMRRRLQTLMCGFSSDQPIVCCTSDGHQTTEQATQLFTVPHGLGVPVNNWQTGSPSENRGSKPWRSTATTTTSTRSPALLNNGDNEQAPDVRQHRNMRLLPSDCGVIESDRIWGGNRTRLYEMPWMVLISYNSARGTKLSCGGTLINERYVLTAAHCVSFLGERLKLSGVVLGEYDVRTDPDCERVEGEKICAPSVQNISIDTVIPHPGYSPQNLFDDIALLRLSERANFNLDSVKPVCLPMTPELQSESMAGQNLVAAGWGATEDGLQSPVLLSVALPAVSNEDCQSVYNGSPHIYNRQMCAGGVQNKDSCGGDSGGPLLFPGVVGGIGARYVQRGIVSYGSKRCGVGGYPGVYTRVGHYMDWILDHMRD